MMPFKPLATIEDLVNAVLRQDERALAAVAGLAGKLVAIRIAGTELTIFVKFAKDGVLLSLTHEAKPNVTIKAGIFTLFALLLERDGRPAGITPELEISGDTGLAQRFQEILEEVEIDWEEHLSHWIGDIAAHQAGRMCRSTRAWLQDARRNLGMNISEYLRYEMEILPTREDVEEFLSAVDVLRNDAERLQQRFDRLQRKI